MARDTFLVYPYFNEQFYIHVDASNCQLGEIISQEGKPIELYRRKLIDAKTRYTVMKKELISIVETLKDLRTILLLQ